jgi:hypothetical protein
MPEEEREEWRQRRAEEQWPLALVDSTLWIRRYRTLILYSDITTGDIGFDNNTTVISRWKVAIKQYNRFVWIDRIELRVSALENVGQLLRRGIRCRNRDGL